jgi:citrate lyase gamma subunit
MSQWTVRWLVGLLGVLFALSLLACSGGGGGGGGTTTFSLSVTGNPVDARVYLNGQQVQDPRRIVLPPGTHRIRVETTLSDGQVIAQEFTIVAGSVSSIQYDLSRYRIETNPTTIEVWTGEQIPVTVTLRDLQTNSVVSADFVFSIRDTNIATAQKLNTNSVQITGINHGATELAITAITELRTSVAVKVPVSVLNRNDRYRIETTPTTIEVWVDEQIEVAVRLRDTLTDSIVSADLDFSVRDPRLATVQKLSANSVRIIGVRYGTTQLRITEPRMGMTFEVPIRVLDFPPPPN